MGELGPIKQNAQLSRGPIKRATCKSLFKCATFCSRQKLHFDVKWFIPLTEVKLENQTQGTAFCVNVAEVLRVGSESSYKQSHPTNTMLIYAEEQKNAAVRKQEVEVLQKRVNILQNELRTEIRKNKSGDHVSLNCL